MCLCGGAIVLVEEERQKVELHERVAGLGLVWCVRERRESLLGTNIRLL